MRPVREIRDMSSERSEIEDLLVTAAAAALIGALSWLIRKALKVSH